MSTDNPSIEDLIKSKDKKPDLLGKKFKVQRTLDTVNRHYEEQEASAKAGKLGFEYLNLHGFPVDLEALALIPKAEAESAQALAFHHESGEVRLGAVDPNSEAVGVLRSKLEAEKYKVKIALISQSSFKEALENYAHVVKAVKLETDKIVITADRLKALAGKREFALPSGRLDATKLLAEILAWSLALKASDIHLEPDINGGKLRFRTDGVLADVFEFTKEDTEKIVSRIKVLAKMKLNIKKAPQDGSFGITLDGMEVDLRVSILPSVYGEAFVLRILKQEEGLTFDQLGITGLTRKRLEEAMEKTTGLILTTGPTGSGKTTTLYSMLKILNKPKVKIITVEDPVEYKIGGITQTPIDKASGISFAQALRSILRQDPDVVMVGEIRDHETADTAVQASLTGHIVLSTLHTNDAVSTISRLIDLEIKPFLIVGSLRVAMAQRLVRRICQKCKVEDKPDEKLMKKIEDLLKAIPASADVKLPDNLTFYASHGCEECHQLGYKGRIGIYEAAIITPDLEKLILREAPASALRQQAIDDGMVSLVQDGLLKALDGVTDVYEVFRVSD